MQSGLASIIIIILNVLFSNKGFNEPLFLSRYKFQIDKILIDQDYVRMITSGFLHVNWTHLLMNMISLYFFSELLESSLGLANFLILYIGSLIGGNLLALFIHRNHGDYSAVGASGAVSGVVFATIAVFPGISIHPLFIPVDIPAWIFGIVYIGYSIYGIRTDQDNIGHEAHLGGALIGMIIGVLMVPQAFVDNYFTILLLLLPTLVFIYFVVTNPLLIKLPNTYFHKHQRLETKDHQYNYKKAKDLEDLDSILDKISRQGIESLTRGERQRLDEYSNRPK